MLESHNIHDLLFPALYAVAILIIIIESRFILKTNHNPNVREARVSVFSGIMAFGGLFLAGRIYSLALMSWFYQFRIFELGFQWYAWLICFVLYDFVFYINHFLGHKVRLLWCIHQVHHSSQRMRLVSGVRGSMFDMIYIPWFFIWMPLLGIHPIIFVTIEVVSKFWGLLVHINEKWVGKLGILENFLVTPVMHRVHHGRNIPYLDTNYGEVLNIWDKIFKTYRTPLNGEPIEYGLTKQIDSGNFTETQFNGFQSLWNDMKQAPGFKEKLLYCIMPPGWNHSGKHQTVSSLRANNAL